MEYLKAAHIARSLIDEIAPFCEKVSIGGSIRRRKPEVKDIEILAIPRWEHRADARDLFGEAVTRRNLLYQWAMERASLHGIQWIKPGRNEHEPGTLRPDGRYWRARRLPEDIKVDMFLPHPDGWGAQLLIRTGSARFTAAVLGHARRVGFRFADGLLWRGEEIVPVPDDEETVFRLLHLAYVPPRERIDAQSLRGL